MAYHRDINHHRSPLSYSECRNRATNVMQGRGLHSLTTNQTDVTAVIGSFCSFRNVRKTDRIRFQTQFSSHEQAKCSWKTCEEYPRSERRGLGVSEGDAKINF